MHWYRLVMMFVPFVATVLWTLSWQTLKLFCILCSSCMWFWGGRPRQALCDKTQEKQLISATLHCIYFSYTETNCKNILHFFILTYLFLLNSYLGFEGENLWCMNTQSFLYLMTFSMQARWRKKALTTGALGGTRGALQRKLSMERTLWKDWKDESCCVRKVIRWHSSVRMTRSRIMGVASSESWIKDSQKKKKNNQRKRCQWDTYMEIYVKYKFTKAPNYTALQENLLSNRLFTSWWFKITIFLHCNSITNSPHMCCAEQWCSCHPSWSLMCTRPLLVCCLPHRGRT